MAIHRVSGQILIRLEAHANYDPGYVRQCVAALPSTKATCESGGVNLLPEAGFKPIGE